MAQPMVVAETQPTCAANNVACAIDTIGYFSKRMCGCKDKACAEGVNNGMTEWGEDLAKKAPEMQNTKPTEAEQKRVMEVVTKYTDCMTKVMMDGQAPPHVDPSDPCGGGNPCGD